MGRRGRAGDPDYGFCRGLLFHAAAWPVDHLQIRNAEARSDSVLQNDPDHHEPERGCHVRLGHRSRNAADPGELESLVDRCAFHFGAFRRRRST